MRDDYFPLHPDRPLWVFAYGSLMWNPEFPHLSHQLGTICGFHRRFCIYSHHYRGTPECPGLVLGLDHGGACRGVVYAVAPEKGRDVLAYLWRREMISTVYRPTAVKVHCADGTTVSACTFVADSKHIQYCRDHSLENTIDLIRRGHGTRGPNADYLAATVAHLDELGIPDPPLHKLLKLVQAVQS